jgi:hypothetical protein
MLPIYFPADTRSAPSSFNLVWRAALKSERFGPRLRLIKRLRVATRPDAIKSRFGLGPVGTVGERSWP